MQCDFDRLRLNNYNHSVLLFLDFHLYVNVLLDVQHRPIGVSPRTFCSHLLAAKFNV